MPEPPTTEGIEPAAVHALLDVLQAAELAWQVLNVPHIRTLRKINTQGLPPQARAVFSRMIGLGARECREFTGKAIDELSTEIVSKSPV